MKNRLPPRPLYRPMTTDELRDDRAKTQRALMALQPDCVQLAETAQRIGTQVAALAKRHGVLSSALAD